MNPIDQFSQEVTDNIRRLREDKDVQSLSRIWLRETAPHKYTYNFTWMGRPIIQLPQDMIALQELVWQIKPDLIIETGIAHGGSIIYSASLLELLGGDGLVIGIDIDIRPHNRQAIEDHPMMKRIRLVQGSSIAPETVAEVRKLSEGRQRILVLLDSNHTHEHVLGELEAYAPLVKAGSYVIVYDTLVDDMPTSFFPDRPWGPGNNPKTAVHEFLQQTDRFEIDKDLDSKLLITVAPDGYLKCVKD
ncbi:MAG: cephalosporin hydroxylase family protein [Candidatus Saccharimonas sp.]|nr:cephalosporin hydroxylase family protein [Planctomycetaceae bacterium]